jgi:hypothetical protein
LTSSSVLASSSKRNLVRPSQNLTGSRWNLVRPGWEKDPANREIRENRPGSFYCFHLKIRPHAQELGTKARVPTAKAQVLGLPARLPMTKAQVLLPSANVLEALARVLTVQADGRAEQKLLKKAEINRKTRKIAKMPRFSLHPSAFPPKRQRRGIVVASKSPMAQAPFRSDLSGWRFAGALRFGVGKRRLKTARRFNAGENAA